MGLFTKLAEPKHDVIKRELKPKKVDDDSIILETIEINLDDYEDFICHVNGCHQEVYTMARYGEAVNDFTFSCTKHLQTVVGSTYIRTEYLRPYIENGLFNIRSYTRYWERQVIKIIPITETPKFAIQPALTKGILIW